MKKVSWKQTIIISEKSLRSSYDYLNIKLTCKYLLVLCRHINNHISNILVNIYNSTTHGWTKTKSNTLYRNQNKAPDISADVQKWRTMAQTGTIITYTCTDSSNHQSLMQTGTLAKNNKPHLYILVRQSFIINYGMRPSTIMQKYTWWRSADFCQIT